MDTEFDVIIVGGGPSGLSAASFLSDKGYNVALFDRNNLIGEDVVCSGVISNEVFDRYDLPTSSIVAKLKDAELVSPYGSSIQYSHSERSVSVVDRHKFDYNLFEKAQQKGAKILTAANVKSIKINEDGALASVILDNEVKDFRSKLIVLATGVRFNLHPKVGFGRPSKILKAIQVEVGEVLSDKLKLFWGSQYSDGFFGWSIPLDDGKTRVGVMTKSSPRESINNLLTELNYDHHISTGCINYKQRGISFGSISKSYSDRVIALGEAAGLVKTTTGGGIFYGILSAEIASEIVDKCFKTADFTENSLSEYETGWKNVIGNEIKHGQYFHNFFSRLSDESIDELFSAVSKDGLLDYISRSGNFDWHSGTVVKILRSPNIRRVLLNGFVDSRLKLAI
ncbi:MAG: NAD(P)/FAD-dependent oxidoreductase [Candidatus Dadabacteria bacterium]|nr:NAD(P)/FAD-dependent oxidoreductase [Candidatus Dadabacteria bacterium]NIS08410.1 NAD(P)/FAD-dependent oxidoreductase [Candidatus Dadabacteria bacterium]NIV41329.1 geranylgeranyl reductase family protein [Candidatus Dadabacteria bacterium]NIY22399.1 geranylgeranyl reductase family protein [Candidatus Dadabacteria bacterium]